MPATMPVESFREASADCLAEARVDRQGRIVKNVVLLGPTSRNGYRYTAEAMQRAVSLYDGKPVFVDHGVPVLETNKDIRPSEANRDVRPPEADRDVRPPIRERTPIARSIRDYAGRVVSARFEGGRIRGDLQLFGPNADWLLPLFESAPADVGMSHVVLARRNSAGDQVERIERVLSVDIVAFPATVQSFRESAKGEACGTGVSPVPLNAPHPPLHFLVSASRLPETARTASLIELLQWSKEPRRTMELLEAWWREAMAETPQSRERFPGEDRLAAQAARRAMVAAVRG